MRKNVANEIHIFAILMLFLVASCSSKNPDDDKDRSMASARQQYELSKVELQRLKMEYIAGDSRAAYRISQHYSSMGPNFASQYIDWLEKSFKKKNRKAGIEFLSSLILTKQCHRYKDNRVLFGRYFPETDINLIEIDKNYEEFCMNR
jgi:hypothetical protein